MSITAGTLRLWLVNLVINAVLLAGVWEWLGIGDSSGGQVALTSLFGLALIFIALWLWDGTLAWFSLAPGERLRAAFARALRTLAPFALLVVIAIAVYWLLNRAEDRASDWAATAASWLTLKLTRPVHPVSIGRTLLWILRILEWLAAPLVLLPIGASVASDGWRGFGRGAFGALCRRWYLLACPALLIAAFWVPYLITHWVPHLKGMRIETASAMVRFAVAWLILITGWIALASISKPAKD